jgi:hypothetical protein
MSKDWTDDEVIDAEVIDDGASPRPAKRKSSRKGASALLILVALGAVGYFKGSTLYNRYWPVGPKSAHATSVSATPRSAEPALPAKPKPISRSQSTAATNPTPDPTPAELPDLNPPANEPEVLPADPSPAPPPTEPKAAVADNPPANPVTKILSDFAQAFAERQAETQRDATAQRNSLLSHLLTVRSQLQQYKLQHGGELPQFKRYPAWAQLIKPTLLDGTVDAKGTFGPYLRHAPVNPLNDSAAVGLSQEDPKPGQRVAATAKLGWVYCVTTGHLFATDTDGKTVYDETAGR